MKKIVLLASLLCLNTTINAQTSLSNEIAYRVKNEAFNNSKIEELSQFMTDYLGPRLAASKLKVRSEELTVQKLEEMGFSNPRIEYYIIVSHFKVIFFLFKKLASYRSFEKPLLKSIKET